ncbi:uncharacterized protein TRIVIDRAFT_200251 [Trichoderma virens Gv29-8]|uniref:Uncharacterized protein n=1 Tax=Hypocrea virens (strain Gv29-8 / FGSC 10586) TaxID=413071 RepID=G9MPX7_HYPVG|nr:uncharacterized protein TRIVIDRAFT_200251 [Trichoderma virens Gv29-8]EHK23927.1 hypothetical protein TRIVIDRAFT_200251 [Trichoderma virens Gv29-8]
MGQDVTVKTEAHQSLLGSLMKDKLSKRKSPLVAEAYYSEAITILRSLPKTTHPVWATLKSQLKKTKPSKKSKSALLGDLEAACAEEDLDWEKLDPIQRACRDEPLAIDLTKSTTLLYKLMGAFHTEEPSFYDGVTTHYKALALDEELANSIFLFMTLLVLFQQNANDHNKLMLYPMLQYMFLDVKSLLETKRGTPTIRQFMKSLMAKPAGSSSGDDDDEVGQEEERPTKRRHCIKIERSE